MWQQFQGALPFILVIALVLCLVITGLVMIDQHRTELRKTAYAEQLGEEYDLELNRLQELQRLQPQEASPEHDPYRQALENVRLRQRAIAKSRALSDKTQPVSIYISNNTIAALNLGQVVGDLNASVQVIQGHGQQQIADAFNALTSAIGESKDINDANRKDLLENLAQVSKQVSAPPISVDLGC